MKKNDRLADKKILVLTYSDIARDSRIQRQLRFLTGSGARVTILSTGEIQMERVISIKVTPRRVLTRRMVKRLRLVFRLYRGLNYIYFGEDEQKIRDLPPHDMIIANDLEAVPWAFQIRESWGVGIPIVLDAHEFTPEQRSENTRWRFLWRPYFYYIARRYLPRLSGMTTVSDGLALLYRKNFGVEPVVVYNAPFYKELSPAPVDPDDIKLVHHGGAFPPRKIEKLIELMGMVDSRFSLHLVLVKVAHHASYYDYLVELAGKTAPDRIHFHEPVFSPDRLPAFLNQFDIGIYLLEQDNMNHMYTIPNKFFDFIQARLMNFTTPYSFDVARITRERELGVVTDGFSVEEAAERLNSLDAASIEKYKKSAHAASKEFCAEKAGERFISLVSSL